VKVPGTRKWKREALERQVWRGGRGAIRRVRIRNRVIENHVNSGRAYGRNRPNWSLICGSSLYTNSVHLLIAL